MRGRRPCFATAGRGRFHGTACKKLKGFQKLDLEPGEEKRILLCDPGRGTEILHSGRQIRDGAPGLYWIYVGDSVTEMYRAEVK